jgi:predicted metal-dependent phosphoesterase TrpH
VGRADLHSHTNLSDGLLSPSELLEAARRARLAALAITDHDTLDAHRSLPPGDHGFEIITGIEFSAFHDGHEMHVLAYFVDPDHPAMTTLVDRSIAARQSRARRILMRLEQNGIQLPAADVEALLASNRVGRPHIARAMVAAKVVGTTTEAFRRYLTPGTPGYERRPDLPAAAEVIAAVRDAGGVAVWAHPGTDCLIDARATGQLQDAGLAGLEAYHPRHSRGEMEKLALFAKRRGLVATGGSDFHGDGREGAKVGDHGVGLDVLDQLKDRRGRRN